MRSFLLALYFLSADQADYNGSDLVFSGKFQVEHPIGVLKAEKATLQQFSEKKRSHLELEKEVSVEVTRGKTPFSIRSKKAFCELPPATLLSLFQFQRLEFFEDVEIKTAESILAKGGSAIYKTGSLHLYPSIPSSLCHLYRGNDQIDAKEIKFDFLKEELHCTSAKGVIQPKTEQAPIHFAADRLIWEKKKEKIHLEGSVRFFSPSIQDKESFSIADEICFSSKDQTLILSAKAPKRVLFWQEGLSLSAPEVYIHLDPNTKKESIEAKGDVHFAFDLEEKNIIDQLLSKYL